MLLLFAKLPNKLPVVQFTDSFGRDCTRYNDPNNQYVVLLDSGATYSFHSHTSDQLSLIFLTLLQLGLVCNSHDVLVYNSTVPFHSPCSVGFLFKHLSTTANLYYDCYSESEIIAKLNSLSASGIIHRLRKVK